MISVAVTSGCLTKFIGCVFNNVVLSINKFCFHLRLYKPFHCSGIDLTTSFSMYVCNLFLISDSFIHVSNFFNDVCPCMFMYCLRSMYF